LISPVIIIIYNKKRKKRKEKKGCYSQDSSCSHEIHKEEHPPPPQEVLEGQSYDYNGYCTKYVNLGICTLMMKAIAIMERRHTLQLWRGEDVMGFIIPQKESRWETKEIDHHELQAHACILTPIGLLKLLHTVLFFLLIKNFISLSPSLSFSLSKADCLLWTAGFVCWLW
jgi:hypothetical protein